VRVLLKEEGMKERKKQGALYSPAKNHVLTKEAAAVAVDHMVPKFMVTF
jgi:hypothetical protein